MFYLGLVLFGVWLGYLTCGCMNEQKLGPVEKYDHAFMWPVFIFSILSLLFG